MALGAGTSLAATITVDGVTCTIVDAVTTANIDTNTGGCVLSDALGGADTIVLPANSTQTLTAVNNTTFGATGIPVIGSEITIQGNGSTVTRMTGASNFRIIAVNSSGNLTIQNTTISGGVIDGTILGLDDGGGIANYGGTVTLSGSTVTGNSAASSGGGVYNLLGTMTLTNSTVSGNSAANNFGGVANFGPMTLSRTIVSGNTGGSSPEVYNFGSSPINVNDYNLFGFNGSSGTNFAVSGTDIVPGAGVMVANILAPLALNSPGTTQTHALVTGSPAIDASPDDTGCQATDQRGVLRPQGTACDIGAFELEVVVPSPSPSPSPSPTPPPVACAGLPPTIVGNAGNNTITGTNGQDVIHGLGGNDTLNGLGGNDVICGGDGNDTLSGMNGRDTINGGKGRDDIFGGTGNDNLRGDQGNDRLVGSSGDDALNGGAGIDDECDGGFGSDTAAGCETTTDVP